MNPNDIKNWLNQPSRYGFESVKKQAALRYIEELEAKTPKWISVEERLPENDDDVLIITEFGLSMGYYDIYQDYWLDYTNGDSNIVTHWRPLPELPKETEE